MSKNLESEYKKMMNDQIPDLWARIEAGLDRDTVSEPERAFTETTKKPASRYRWKMFAGIAAAAACLCIIIPTALSVTNSNQAVMNTMTAEAETDLAEEKAQAKTIAFEKNAMEEEAMDAAVMEEAAPEKEAMEETAMADSNPEESAMENSSGDLGYGSEIPESISLSESAEELYSAEEAEAAEEYAAEEAAIPSEGSITEAAEELPLLAETTFEIKEGSEESSADALSGSITAVILSCPADPSLEGNTVTLIRPAEENAGSETISELPSEAGTYTGTLQLQADGSYALLSLSK